MLNRLEFAWLSSATLSGYSPTTVLWANLVKAAITDPTALVDPAVRPDADLIIYDGKCRFCRAQVERLARWDRSGRLAFISLHDPRVAERFPDLSHEQLMEDMYLIDRQGRRYRGAAALRYLSRHLRPLWLGRSCAAHSLQLARLAVTVSTWSPNVVTSWGKLEECDDGTCHVHYK